MSTQRQKVSCCALPILLVSLGLVAVSSGPRLPGRSRIGGTMRKIRRWNIRFYRASVAVWLIGFGTAYLALPLYLWLEGV